MNSKEELPEETPIAQESARDILKNITPNSSTSDGYSVLPQFKNRETPLPRFPDQEKLRHLMNMNRTNQQHPNQADDEEGEKREIRLDAVLTPEDFVRQQMKLRGGAPSNAPVVITTGIPFSLKVMVFLKNNLVPMLSGFASAGVLYLMYKYFFSGKKESAVTPNLENSENSE